MGDAPSYVAFQATPLQTFWPVTVLLVGTIEIFGIFAFESPFDGKWWTLKSEHTGRLFFRPRGPQADGRCRAQGHADQGAEQRPPRDDRDRWHGRPGARDGREALLD